MKEGPGEEWFDNGVLKTKGDYKGDGVSGSYVKIFNNNGSVMHSGRLASGIKEGYGTKWHRNGKPNFSGLFKGSLPDGNIVTIHGADGSVSYTGKFSFDVFYKYK
jgi:antitoxin component YwqK of YwqJK toxin-antitoxin module